MKPIKGLVVGLLTAAAMCGPAIAEGKVVHVFDGQTFCQKRI